MDFVRWFVRLSFCCMVGVASTAVSSPSMPGGGRRLRFEPVNPVEIRLSGSSTLHSWEAWGTHLQGAMEATVPETVWDAWQAKAVNPDVVKTGMASMDSGDKVCIRLRVPVQTLQSRRERMREDLMRAIDATRHPFIEYEFTGLDNALAVAHDGDNSILDVKAVGRLTLAGTTNRVVTESRIRWINANIIEFSGRIPLNMLDFGIEPPVALLGLLRAHPDFDVNYRFQVQSVSDGAGAKRRQTAREKSAGVKERTCALTRLGNH